MVWFVFDEDDKKLKRPSDISSSLGDIGTQLISIIVKIGVNDYKKTRKDKYDILRQPRNYNINHI